MSMKNKLLIKQKKSHNFRSFDNVQATETGIKWNYGQKSTFFHFWKNDMDNIESFISNNIRAELKLQNDKQEPTKAIKQSKTKLRTLKDAYKKTKYNNMTAGTAPMTCLFYNDMDEF